MKPIAAGLALALAAAAPAGAQQPAGLRPFAGAGDPLPGLEFRPLGARQDSPRWRPSELKGRRPLLLVYWLNGSERATELLDQARGLIRDLQAAGVEVVVITSVKPPETESDILRSARELRLDAPIVLDEELEFSSALGIESVPALTFVDREGTVRLARAQHLMQIAGTGESVEDWLRAGAATGEWPTVERLEPHHPARELIGRPYEDFTLPELVTLRPRSLASLLAPGRHTLLVFWSVQCGHCLRWLPELAAWYEKEGRERIGLVSVASAGEERIRSSTARFIHEGGIRFPVLMDSRLSLQPVYRVNTLPALVLIAPDGTIEAFSAGSSVSVSALLEGRVAPAEGDASGAEAETNPHPPQDDPDGGDAGPSPPEPPDPAQEAPGRAVPRPGKARQA